MVIEVLQRYDGYVVTPSGVLPIRVITFSLPKRKFACLAQNSGAAVLEYDDILYPHSTPLRQVYPRLYSKGHTVFEHVRGVASNEWALVDRQSHSVSQAMAEVVPVARPRQ